MKNHKHSLIAGFLILITLWIGLLSFWGDALTTDESPHISAGYTYLTERDMRLNPEHPPLIKDLAALPLLFQNVHAPTEHSSWTDDVNGQWDFGRLFFFGSGNDPDGIMRASRAIMLLFLALIGIYLFKWARERYGSRAALFALALLAFSPTFLAHGRLVTTDVGATFGFLFALYYFVKFTEQPTKRNIVLAGVSFGIAQLLKFSLVLLIPTYAVLFIIWWIFEIKTNWKLFGRYIAGIIAIFVIGYALLFPVYQFHVSGYPAERQLRDTSFLLQSHQVEPLRDVTVWMADKPVLRAYAQYLLGFAMVFQRTAGGNTTYFLGDVTSTAWKEYFPTVFGLKEPLPILILIITAAAVGITRLIRRKVMGHGVHGWVRHHLPELACSIFIAIYWGSSIMGNLNIGVRHVLPTFPFIYLLVTWGVAHWVRTKVVSRSIRLAFISVLLLWYIVESALTFPFYLSYFNELAGGPANGYKYVVDSNLDWGQDLKRLAKYVEENNIEKIKIDYFGGDSPPYRLGDRYEPLDRSVPYQSGWLAISATHLQNGRGVATKGFDQSTTHYMWLNEYKPVAQIGYSIFVYHIPER